MRAVFSAGISVATGVYVVSSSAASGVVVYLL
jgi:hypothetical protein